MTLPAPGPFYAVKDHDGRHNHVPILSDAPELNTENDEHLYHPLIGCVYIGRGHAPRDIAEATAAKMALAYNTHESLVAALTAMRDYACKLNCGTHHDPVWVQVADVLAKTRAV